MLRSSRIKLNYIYQTPHSSIDGLHIWTLRISASIRLDQHLAKANSFAREAYRAPKGRQFWTWKPSPAFTSYIYWLYYIYNIIQYYRILDNYLHIQIISDYTGIYSHHIYIISCVPQVPGELWTGSRRCASRSCPSCSDLRSGTGTGWYWMVLVQRVGANSNGEVRSYWNCGETVRSVRVPTCSNTAFDIFHLTALASCILLLIRREVASLLGDGSQQPSRPSPCMVGSLSVWLHIFSAQKVYLKHLNQIWTNLKYPLVN